MLAKSSCEICGENDWQVLGQRTYTEAEGKKCSPYKQKRFRVLFDKWFSDKKSVTLTSILCKHCGLIMYIPRPEEEDIDSKYRYLEVLGQDYGRTAHDSPVERRRSNGIFRYLNKNTDLTKVNKVLDYGGGDGRLMYAFCNIGKQCYLVDYNKNCAQGVTKLSDTIRELNPSMKFDLIICSHVMEHIAQPLRTLKLLISHLDEEGHIFIEVPLEVWKHAPLPYEPVTHVNFFTPNSLHNFLLIGGLVVKKCEMAAGLHQSGEEFHVVRAIATRPSNSRSYSNAKLLDPDGMKLLRPNISRILHYYMCVPWEIPKIVLGRLRRFARRFGIRAMFGF